jgi:hypothetical protein
MCKHRKNIYIPNCTITVINIDGCDVKWLTSYDRMCDCKKTFVCDRRKLVSLAVMHQDITKTVVANSNCDKLW